MMCREMANIVKGKSTEIKTIVGKKNSSSDVNRSISRDTVSRNRVSSSKLDNTGNEMEMRGYP